MSTDQERYAGHIYERFWSKVDKAGPPSEWRPDLGSCWLWTAGLMSYGYGGFHPTHDNKVTAHRFSYVATNGPVPDGLVLDHLCRVNRCVNPDHLEAVTQAENLRRGAGYGIQNGMRDHCLRGHDYTPENTYVDPSGRIRCRTCARSRRVPNRKEAA